VLILSIEFGVSTRCNGQQHPPPLTPC